LHAGRIGSAVKAENQAIIGVKGDAANCMSQRSDFMQPARLQFAITVFNPLFYIVFYPEKKPARQMLFNHERPSALRPFAPIP